MIYLYITTDNIKPYKSVFMLDAWIYVRPNGFEYFTSIEDGDRPKGYLQGFEYIQPPGRSCNIVGTTKTLDEAKAKLQEIADKYGSIFGRVPVFIVQSDKEDDEDI